MGWSLLSLRLAWWWQHPPRTIHHTPLCKPHHHRPSSACTVITTMAVARLYCPPQPATALTHVLATTGGAAAALPDHEITGQDTQPVAHPSPSSSSATRRVTAGGVASAIEGMALDQEALHDMGGVRFAVGQLTRASAASTRRAWLGVVLHAGGAADGDAAGEVRVGAA